jgi:hypothetical protein
MDAMMETFRKKFYIYYDQSSTTNPVTGKDIESLRDCRPERRLARAKRIPGFKPILSGE